MLMRMVEDGQLTQQGAGKGTYYELTSNSAPVHHERCDMSRASVLPPARAAKPRQSMKAVVFLSKTHVAICLNRRATIHKNTDTVWYCFLYLCSCTLEAE